MFRVDGETKSTPLSQNLEQRIHVLILKIEKISHDSLFVNYVWELVNVRKHDVIIKLNKHNRSSSVLLTK